MRTMGFSLMVVCAVFFTLGSLQPGYAMSFGKHNNGSGPANQSISQRNGNGNGNRNGNTYEASCTAALFASGVLGLGLWRWKKQS
jgi:hypothetical protein